MTKLGAPRQAPPRIPAVAPRGVASWARPSADGLVCAGRAYVFSLSDDKLSAAVLTSAVASFAGHGKLTLDLARAGSAARVGAQVGAAAGSACLLPLAGHLGWAVERQDGTFVAGEHIPSGPIRQELQSEDELFAYFDSRRMTSYKVRDLNEGHLGAALEAAEETRARQYHLFGNNCINETYRVLSAYGWSWLPLPCLAILGALWFLSIPVRSRTIPPRSEP